MSEEPASTETGGRLLGPEDVRRQLARSAFAEGSVEASTPCLVVDRAAFDHNVETMAAVLPGTQLRPHVKAFKSTALARRLHEAGHHTFTCATLGEVEGMLAADLGQDLLLANQTLDVTALRRVMAAVGAGQQVTVAVDSSETIAAARAGGVGHVLIDVFVGLPRCGCPPDQAGALADEARRAGLEVRGVMGYEGHLMMEPEAGDNPDGPAAGPGTATGALPESKAAKVQAAMTVLTEAASEVGGDIVSAGGTGTHHLHLGLDTGVTEIQAGSYTLMDTDYARLGLPFLPALWVEATIISRHPDGWLVADAGLKAFGMDHGNPIWPFGDVWFCSDEHTTLWPDVDLGRSWRVGDRVRLAPAHVDPTVAKHRSLVVVGGTGSGSAAEGGIEIWPVDLRHW